MFPFVVLGLVVVVLAFFLIWPGGIWTGYKWGWLKGHRWTWMRILLDILGIVILIAALVWFFSATVPAAPAQAPAAPAASVLKLLPADASAFSYTPTCSDKDGTPNKWSGGDYNGTTFLCEKGKWVPQHVFYKGVEVQIPPNSPQSAATQPPVANATQAPVVTKAPVATQAPAATATPATVAKTDPFAGYAACPYKGTGSPQPEKVDVATFKLPDGTNAYALDLSKLPGCAIIFEGTFPWQPADAVLAKLLADNGVTDNGSAWDLTKVHFVVDVRSKLGNFDPTNYNKLVSGIPDQYAGWFVYSQGSIWFYDPTWNMSNFKTTKPSIAQEFEGKKFQQAMVPGNYIYPRIIMQPNGAMFAFWQTISSEVAYANGIAAGCTHSDQPELIPVYGLYDGKQFSAAIGAGNCKMVYWADGSTTPVVWHGYQKDGKEIVTYNNVVIAYIFPAAWSMDQVNAWVAKQ